MDVSIVIVNYNTSSLLKNCLESIALHTKNLSYEIIVVDNASRDDSTSMVRENYPLVKIIECNENLGFGRANNKGAELSNGKYIFFLNTDTLLINNAIKVLFDTMEEEGNGDIGACGGNLYKMDYSPNYSYTLYFPSLWSVFCYRGHIPFFVKSEFFNDTDKIKDVALIIGADLFIRRALFEEINGFDPLFFMYVEDTELLYRLQQKHYRIVSNPEARIFHLQGASSSNVEKLRMEMTSYFIYFRKHHNLFTVNVYRLIELFFATLKMIVSLMTFNKKRSVDYFSIIVFLLNASRKNLNSI